MRLSVFFDVETTGLPVFSKPSSSAIQPHIVQLAALLVDMDSRTTISSMDVIIRPDGWTIPDDVAAIHGITTEHATEVGVPEREAIALFLQLGAGRLHVAHNSSFDERIMRIALKRHYDDSTAEEFKRQSFECTMRLASPIMALPPSGRMVKAGFNKHKPPNLAEAYQYFTGRTLEGAHNAMTDVLACKDIYFAMMDRETERKA